MDHDQAAEHKFGATITYNGSSRTFEVNAHEAVKALLAQALSAFGITTNPHLQALYFPDNREITDVTKSIADWGIVAGTVLVLRQSAVLAG
jgi:hypothetical protein